MPGRLLMVFSIFKYLGCISCYSLFKYSCTFSSYAILISLPQNLREEEGKKKKHIPHFSFFRMALDFNIKLFAGLVCNFRALAVSSLAFSLIVLAKVACKRAFQILNPPLLGLLVPSFHYPTKDRILIIKKRQSILACIKRRLFPVRKKKKMGLFPP